MQNNGLCVHSEIGTLKKVLVHRIGWETGRYRVEDFDRVFSHDATFVQRAQEEHDVFTDLLRKEGVEVLYLENLVAEALDAGGQQARAELIEKYLLHSDVRSPLLLTAIKEMLSSIQDSHALVMRMIEGLQFKDIDMPSVGGGLVSSVEGELGKPDDLLVIPFDSLVFTRDPISVVGRGVNINRMYWPQRNREIPFYETIFNYHPSYCGAPRWYTNDLPFHAEGGDVLNIDAHTLAIGLSQRTEPGAIDLPANRMFWGDLGSEIERIYAFTIPKSYAFMHLDTVFTQIDHDAFTYYPEIERTLSVYKITKGAKEGECSIELLEGTLASILEEILGIDHVRLIPCAGGDPVQASREQFNDGSNTLCVKPGTVCVYERNVFTNEVLSREGFELLVVPSAELSRGRGGPRCMSMPFEREEI